MNIVEIKNYLYQLGGASRGLDNFEQFLKNYDSPHKKLKTIQVLGTNGKGSTTAFLQKLLEHKYQNVATFTSPALIDVYDRIQINRIDISEEDFAKIFNLIYEDSVKYHLGFFEILCAIAFIHFANNNVDYAIIEAGVGGERDCTSVIDSNIRLLTNVGFDHTDVLGESLEEILLQKIGACRKGDLLLTTVEDERLKTIISKWCSDNGVDYKFIANDIDYKLSLNGEFQKYNAKLAYQCSRELGINYSEALYQTIFESVCWRGRFEKLFDSIYIDGAHNIDGARKSLATANEVFGKGNYVIVSSVLKGKDLYAFNELYLENASKVIFTTFDYPRAMTVKELAEFNVETNFDLEMILKDAINSKQNYLFTGSLYFITEILKKVG